MRFRIHHSAVRRAAVVPLAAFLVVFLVGMLAFSIDIGYICAVKAELQNAADSAALAGAQQMQNAFVSYYSPGQTQQQAIFLQVTTDTNSASSPIPTAQTYASYNKAGGISVRVPASDVTFSYYDGTTFTPASYPANFPNTITVTTRRDNVANGPLGLFFAQIFGVSTTNLTATASATIYAGDGNSFQAITNSGSSGSGNGNGGVAAHILPVALDVNVWQAFIDPSNYSNGQLISTPNSQYISSSNVTNGPNNLPQLQVYPFNTNTPGSFGLVDTGVPANNTPAFVAWIDSGSTPNDITYLLNNNLLPVSPSAPEPWKVGPGLTSTLVSNFQSQMGVPNLIPLFQPVSPLPSYVAASGTGQGATYAIVGFVGVTVTQANGNGNAGLIVSIQPSAIVDPTQVIPNPAPAGSRVSGLSVYNSSSSTTQTPLQTTFVSAKLTQ